MVQNPAFWGLPGTYFNFLKFLFFIYLFFVLASFLSKCKVAWNFASISNCSELIVSYNIREGTWIK
jgi:hypothetical protein